MARTKPEPQQAQTPDTSIIDQTITTTTDASEQSALDCAWCLHEQGIIPLSGSHGICPPHADAVRRQAAERRAQREAQA